MAFKYCLTINLFFLILFTTNAQVKDGVKIDFSSYPVSGGHLGFSVSVDNDIITIEHKKLIVINNNDFNLGQTINSVKYELKRKSFCKLKKLIEKVEDISFEQNFNELAFDAWNYDVYLKRIHINGANMNTILEQSFGPKLKETIDYVLKLYPEIMENLYNIELIRKTQN